MLKGYSYPLIISMISLMFLVLSCRDDDDMPPIPSVDPEIQVINVNIPSGIESRVCVDATILELLDEASISSTSICSGGSAATVTVQSVVDECINLDPADGFTGESPDTLCVIHCFNTSPQVCDTTHIIVTVESSFLGGVYITNEGPFQTGTGTITFYDPQTQQISENIFQAANQRPLGNIVQSMGFTFDMGYILVNNANKIEVVDLSDFSSEKTIEGLALPRYFCQYTNDRAAVSQWGQDGLTGSIAIIDLNSNELINTIPTPGKGPEALLCLADYIIVAQSGGFGRDSTIAFLNTNDLQLEMEMEVGDVPTGLILDSKGQAWSLARGYFDFSDPSNNTPGQLSILGDQSVFNSIALPNGANNLVYDPNEDRIYYSAENKVWKIDLAGAPLGEIPVPEEFIASPAYKLGVDPENGDLYLTDAGDFQSNGEVHVYDRNAQLIDTFEAGIIPGGVFFN